MKKFTLLVLTGVLSVLLVSCKGKSKEIESIEDPLEEVREGQKESMDEAKERARIDEKKAQIDSLASRTARKDSLATLDTVR